MWSTVKSAPAGSLQLICRMGFGGRFCYNSRVKGRAAKQTYERGEVCRLLSVSERQLQSWEKQGLVLKTSTYGFPDLIALRTLASLKASGVRPERVRQVLSALRSKLKNVSDPLRELKVYSDGHRIGVQVAGQRMEPITGQLLFDFDAESLKKLLAFSSKGDEDAKAGQAQRRQAEDWFLQGLELEQTGAPIERAVEAYKQAVAEDPGSTGALVNLGTIYFKKHVWKDAEKYYRKAIEADDTYALAHFNLGNLHDERGNYEKALEHYLRAVKLDPSYADAHYNLALLSQTMGQAMKALHHWQIYLKLDPGSQWSAIARREMETLRKSALVVTGRARLGVVS